MTMRTILALVACTLLCLGGCSWATKPDAPEVQIAKIAVQLGVSKFIAKAPEPEQAARAKRIAAVARDVDALARGGEGVSLPLLEAAIRANLPGDLKPEDRIAINALVEIVLAELRNRVGEGLLKPEQALVVSSVASWITDACELYAG
jgi:hypothetical protein